MQRLSVALSVAALIVAALGSTPLGRAALAQVLPANSVGTSQVRDHSLLARDFKGGQLPRGEQGPPGTIDGVAAAGALTGSYPAPQIAADAVSGAQVVDGGLSLEDTAALTGQVRIDAPAVPARSCLSLTAVVTGAKAYDRTLVLPTQNLPNGLFVTQLFNTKSANRIAFRLCNATGATLEPPLGAWAYVVWRS